MENARGLGRHLAGRLAASGECVVDVPPKLSARVKVLSSFAGNARKNDGLDALATALSASRNERLAPVDPETDSEVLRLLSERREDLVAERTQALNRLHGLLRDLLPGGVAGKLSADRAARILRGIRARGCASDRLRRRLASEVLRDVRTLDRKIADLSRIEAEIEVSGTTLTEIFGIGPILAATILGTGGNVTRFPTKARFASYSGTAPVEASSGEVVHRRLSLAGNRKLSYALHMVATSQARSDAPGGSYYRKKLDEGKSRKEALRLHRERNVVFLLGAAASVGTAHEREAGEGLPLGSELATAVASEFGVDDQGGDLRKAASVAARRSSPVAVKRSTAMRRRVKESV
jgi:transposase